MYIYAMINRILVCSAVVPALALLVYVYKADRLEAEPGPLLVKLVLYGILSTFFALFAEIAGSAVLGQFFGEENNLYNIIFYFCVVGLAEEGSKYYLLKKCTWNDSNFNCMFDGVVYAAFVSLGFALWENISYVLNYGIATALIRAVTAVPGHACFGVFMGVFYGKAKKAQKRGNEEEEKTYRMLALLVPVLIHGSYDYIATLTTEASGLIFLAFVVLMFAAAFAIVSRESKQDTYI